MATLTVGAGQQYTTIAAAVQATASGDVVDVKAGTYINDFLTVTHNLTIEAVGGAVNLVATAQPPNGKAIIDEGGAGVSVKLSGLTLSGATVGDGNGAGVRYEGGTLLMTGMVVTGNQDGLLGAADSAGSITIDNSTFSRNGAGDGYTHNIYVGNINSLTLTNSSITDADAGHDVKSRAANNLITGTVITDTAGSASYEIDLPNGGNAVISNNTIEKGVNAQNPVAISYGEEGNLYASGSLSVANNEIVNDLTSHSTTAVRNSTGVVASVTGDTFYGWGSLSAGSATLAGNMVATTEPALTKPTGGSTGMPTAPVAPPPVVPTPPAPVVPTPPAPVLPTPPAPVLPTPPAPVGSVPAPPGLSAITLDMSEDAWNGDAAFTVSVDGKQYGQTLIATASHTAGKTQAISVFGAFGTGPHTVAVDFLNDAYGGTAATDRNLYVDSIVDGETITKGAALLSSGTQSFIVGPAASAPAGPAGGKIVLQMSEDAYQGNAAFTVQVDGRQVGGTLTTTALHNLGATQEFDIAGAFASGSHTVGISFVNDAYGGSAATDRNLHVDMVGGVSVNDTLFSNGTHNFATVVKAS